ncbi:glycosyltransferase [Agromyces intestinalis]|uniref:Glycosyltransferase n=1 Tax=Agromyces intestinalis TaxID=2592652 RepID=A0A5C1YC39_9MICO|nr:glycosyltransferase [Agromyces intestinalis]QEO13566.1 glycosyltransferase [Agromyces intestinalis]
MAEVPFTLLMPVYRGDDPVHFARAFTSTVIDQRVRPSQVVLVQDGPVGDELAAAIHDAIAQSPVPVTFEAIEHNVGLARALTRGLALSEHDIVARMDADDVSLSERFARQLPLVVDGADLVGTGMLEFLDDDGSVVGRRVPRTAHDDIVAYSRFHDPFSHPTVMYRRSAVERAGGYEPMGLMEDYWLFARMIHSGASVANLADPLVMYRVGAGAYARRGGRAQWRSELALQKALRGIGFTTRAQYLRNVAVRGVYRFVPERIRTVMYRRWIAGGEA